MPSHITYDVADGIATITLNRPDRLNAFTQRMCDEMIEAFDASDVDDDVRAVIVTGAGRAFCAGADLGRGAETFLHGGGGRGLGPATRWGAVPADLPFAQAGHRGDERPGRRGGPRR